LTRLSDHPPDPEPHAPLFANKQPDFKGIAMTSFPSRILASALLLAVFSGAASGQTPALFDGKEPLAGYPEQTLLIEVKDARKAADLVKKAGGEVVYDPNLGIGHDIPFLVVNLPGEKIVDRKFIESLELKAGVASFPNDCGCEQPELPEEGELNFDSLFVPIEDIKLPELRQRAHGGALGKGTLVAVIDTGIDASHPVFQKRVVFWSDATREGRISLEKVRVIEGKIRYQDKDLTVPKRIAENKEVFVGVFDETAMGVQFRDAVKTAGNEGLDFNRNGSVKDSFLVMIGLDTQTPAAEPKAQAPAAEKKDEEKKEETEQQTPSETTEGNDEEPEAAPPTDAPAEEAEGDEKKEETEAAKKQEAVPSEEAKKQPAESKPATEPKSTPRLIAFFDTDGDGQIKDKEAERAIWDFNTARKTQRDGQSVTDADMVAFPSRTRTIAYPLLFEADSKGEVKHATLGVDFRSHGTHVAGIIAGNGDEIRGAAPEAEIMAIKTCSGITCTDAAILRGLLAAFFNPQGYVPDVVNISLGSPEGYEKTGINLLIQDLSAKFGTVFCISASNGGAGYRTINHLGSLSPAILVGAHVSKQTLTRHYRLQDGVEVPEHGLLHFTSVGPSYTGQLRPNLVAPGSALSSTPLIEEGSAMLNGTSMSAPITAGAVASLLSFVRLDNEYARLEKWRQEKIQSVRDKVASENCSLTSLPLAVRTALEESAEPLPQFTIAQQGHGLLNIDAAQQRLLALAARINNDRLRFAEFKINGNSQSGRLYDRSNNIPPVKQVALTLDEDGELTEATRLRLRNAATLVRLERVQIQSIDGTVEELAADQAELPFSVGVPGKEGGQGRSLVLVLSNPANRGSFLSVRRLEQMETGKTYIAQYNVYQNDQRLLTLLDVVHKPIELSDLETEVNLPGIEVNLSRRVASYTNRNQAVAARSFHRYPVAVTQRDSTLSVELGFGRDSTGMLMLQIYDPDGYLAGMATIRKSPQLTSEQRTARAAVSTRDKEGIWEVTVSSYSGSWVGASGYDLLIEAYRFVPSVERLSLGTKQVGSGGGPNERIVSLMNSSRQVKSVTLNWGKTERIAPLKPFGIIPNHRTYKKVPLPEWDEKQGGSKTTTVVLELDRASKINEAVQGRIDHRLYRRTSDGKYEVAHSAEKAGGGSDRKTFRDIPRPEAGRSAEPLYAAMEVFGVSAKGPALSQFVERVDMLVVYPDLPVRFKEPLHAGYLGSDSTDQVKLVRVRAPEEVLDETTKPTTRSSKATLKVDTGDPRVPEISVELPVTLADKPATNTGKALERARSTLEIKTDHPHITVTIPVVVQQ
jgi:tripeptidyl-peptidase II